MAHKKPTISGFFPFLNDWGTIGSLVASLDSSLQKISSNYEIIIVDDGSEKNSKQVLHTLKRHFPKLRLITHKNNRGYGGAIKSGIRAAKMDWIFYTDGDAQYDPREIEKLWKAWDRSSDVINGYKIKRYDPWYRIILGKIYHYTVRLLLMTPIRDTDCDFRLMRRSIFDYIDLKANSGLICSEMIKKIHDAGYVFQEVPVTHFWRTSGKSQFFNFNRTLKMAWGLIDHWYNLEFKKMLQITKLHNKYFPESILTRLGRITIFLFYFISTRLGFIDLVIILKKTKIIGFATLFTPTSEINSIIVDKPYQKSGNGKFLITQLIRHAKINKTPQISAKCLVNNSTSNIFFERNKFKKDRQFNYWNNRFNSYILPRKFFSTYN